MANKSLGLEGDRQREKNLKQGQASKTKKQVKNSDGAFVFGLSDEQRLERFLILGTEGGSYYASERSLTKENLDAVKRLIKDRGTYVVERVAQISEEGRAPKNDYALFVLAMCSSTGNDETRKAAYSALPRVARIGTHLFHFIKFREQFAGWSGGLRRAVARWYNEKDVKSVSFQMGKYQSRDGWSHRDVLRLAHVNPGDDESRSTVYKWATKPEEVSADVLANASPVLSAYEEIKATNSDSRIVELLNEHRLGLEFVPTDKRSRKVYESMIENFGVTALIRNLNQLTAKGILDSKNFTEVNRVVERLTDANALAKGRVHPISILYAQGIYNSGRGLKGSLTWTPNQKIVDALDEAFYLSFKNIETTGKRWMLALDVSGSMGTGAIAGTNITPRVASAAMSMVTARTEKNYLVTGFTSGSGMSEINITPKQNLKTVVDKVSRLSMGSTDCSLPMLWALKNKVELDAFVVYTDSETNGYNRVQPMTALKRYRDEMGIDAKLIVVGMVSNGFTIADPDDKGALDVVGFDTATPNIMSEFVKGNL